MKIRNKLFIGFFSMLGLFFITAFVLGYIFFKAVSINNEIENILTQDMFLDEAIRDHLAWTNELSNMLLLDTPFTKNIDPLRCKLGKWYYESKGADLWMEPLYDSLEEPHLALHESAKEIISCYRAGKKEEARKIYAEKTISYMRIVQSRFLRLSQISMQRIDKLKEHYLKMESFLKLLSFFVPLIAFLLALLISIIISRRITGPLNRVIEKIKSFNLFTCMPFAEFSNNPKDEISELGHSFNQLIKELQDTREKMIAIADPLFCVDTNLVITYFSKAAEELIGYKKEEVFGKKCGEVFKSDLCEYNCIMKLVLEKGKTVHNIEACVRTKSGKTLAILLSAAPLKGLTGNIKGGVEVFKDITLLKATLNELSQTRDKLFYSERVGLLGQITGGLAHELNTPLARIKLTLEYLKRFEEGSELDLKDIREGFKIINNDVIECERVVSNVLSFVRIKMPITEAVDLNAVVPKILNKLKYFEHLKDIKVKLNLDKNLPKINADSGQIKLVLLNVIRNAAEAMKNKGILNIETLTKSDCVQLSVKDSGQGIASEDLPTIFEPFYSTKPGGSGLGLAISAAIIKAHKGNIDVKSEQGKGTEIIIKLPVDFTST